MKIQILISTMHLKNAPNLLDKMNISTNALIINQCDKNSEQTFSYHGHDIKLINTSDRGLSKSRNLAIEKSDADIIIFADDDFRYADGYSDMIINAYSRFDKADAVIFGAVRNDGFVYRQIPNGKVSSKYKYSINSIRITAKRRSIIDKNLSFDENFGSGTEIGSGEDTIFVSDCFAKKIGIYSENSLLCKGIEENRPSTWWCGYNDDFFKNRGKIFKRLSGLYFFMVLYFALKQHSKYKNRFSFFTAVKLMLIGAAKYR